MKKFVFFIFLALFLTACERSLVSLNKNNELIVEHNDRTYVISDTVVEKESLYFKDTNVNRFVVTDVSNKRLFYEELSADEGYEVSSATVSILKQIFGVNSVNIVYSSSNLLLIQLEQEYDYINLIAQTGDVEILRYVYGFNNDEFFKIADSVGIIVSALKVKNTFIYQTYLTKWNQVDLTLNPVVQTRAGWGGF